jgi:transposase
MGKTLSEDLRVRVIAAIDGGLSRNAAAARFGVAISTAVRWARAWRETGTTAAKPKGGDLRSHRIEAHRAAIFAAVDAKPDITLEELAALLRTEHAASFSPSTICRFFARHRVTFKKNRARQRAGQVGRGGAAASLVRRAA